MSEIDWTELAAPFPPDGIEWRVGQVAQSGKTATLLAYLTSRAVMDRLDTVVGPANWRDAYTVGPGGGVMCGISIRVGDEWVTKHDAAENTAIEPIKGGVSDALKRAAVKWGIGRYLYRLPEYRQDVTEGWPPRGRAHVKASWGGRGEKKYGWCELPRLPEWALPTTTGKARPAEVVERRAAHDSGWETGGRAAFFAALGAGFPVAYGDLKIYLEANNKPKPSAMDGDTRTKLVSWLKTDAGLSRVTAWLDEHHA